MDVIIPCVLCRKAINDSVIEAGDTFIFRCGCGVVVIVPKNKFTEANRKALIGMAIHQAGANPECN